MPKPPNNKTDETPIRIAEITIRLEQFGVLLERLTDTIEGTVKTHGLKEKITIAQMDIEANKQAYKTMNETIGTLKKEFAETLRLLELNMTNALSNSVSRIEQKIDESNLAQNSEINTQKNIIQKMTPWFTTLTWVITGAASIILGLLLSGKMHISFP